MIDLNLNPSRKELRVFALLQVAFFALVSFLAWRKGSLSTGLAGTIIAVSAVLGLIGLIRPPSIRWFYAGWMLAVYPIGWTVSHLMLAVVFFLVITPIGGLMRLLGHDPMRRKFEPGAKSYWEPRPQQSPPERYFRQF